MTDQTVPTTITTEQLHAALTALGLDQRDVAEVVMRARSVRVTRFRRDAGGHRYLDAGLPATVVTTVAVRDEVPL